MNSWPTRGSATKRRFDDLTFLILEVQQRILSSKIKDLTVAVLRSRDASSGWKMVRVIRLSQLKAPQNGLCFAGAPRHAGETRRSGLSIYES